MFHGLKADMYFTGEMPQHSVLAAVAGGGFVALCKSDPIFRYSCVCSCIHSLGGHTNTERGYLRILAEKLKNQLQSEAQHASASSPDLASALSSLEIHVSTADKHPLLIV